MRSPSLVAAAAVALAVTAAAQSVVPFPVPPRTRWKPSGCRTPDPGAEAAAFASRGAWRNLHADEVNTDEVAVAYPPMFVADWVAEPATWNPTGPVFDDAGHLYFAPSSPAEGVALISLDPVTGARRWAIPNTTGAPVGGGAPLVLDDPDRPGEQIVYLGLYDRVIAVATDGTILWDRPTGLSGAPSTVFGLNYHPGADALIGVTRDGWIYAVDRRTGVGVLAAPHQLPGEPTPPAPPSTVPQSIRVCAEDQLHHFTTFNGRSLDDVIGILQGNGVEVANFFSIDPATGRLWLGATAPDAEDGTVDGVSQLGALYHLNLVGAAGSYVVAETCHASFAGGTASTPALPHDGSRVYVGDNVGNLLAIGPACETIWSLPVGGQVTGSIGVAADNREVYASTATTIHQVIDHGASAHLAWSADLGAGFDLLPGQITGNTDLAGIGANAVAFQAGAGYRFTATLFTATGMGLLDRRDGALRWFTPGLDETVAVMSTGPDGALYIGNSPLRRAYAVCLAQAGIITTPVSPLVGGIRKYRPVRYDVFLRDVLCAGSDRLRNARRTRKACPASYAAERAQLDVLLAQARRTLAAAVAAGDLAGPLAARVDARLGHAAGADAARVFLPLCRTIQRAVGR